MTALDAEPPVPPRRARRWRRVLLAGIALAAVVLIAGGSYFAWGMGGSRAGRPVAVVISEGATANQIAGVLAQKGVVRSAFVFRVVARIRGVSAEFKPGAYELRSGLGVSGAIEALRKGIPDTVERFTVPEGLTVRETAAIIGRETHVPVAAFLSALTRTRTLPAPLAAHLGRRAPSRPEDFEGFLFPNTYEISARATPGDVVATLLSQFDRETEPLHLDAAARAHGLTTYGLITLASLVEKEARCREDLIAKKAPCANDHAFIASVIYNRLREPMRLQIDATIQYVYIERNGHAKDPLQTSDYSLDSPYNTYRIDGLPPTPIAGAGLRSIRAAISPASTSFLFYRLCNPDMLIYGHVFGRTIGERDQKWRSDRHCA